MRNKDKYGITKLLKRKIKEHRPKLIAKPDEQNDLWDAWGNLFNPPVGDVYLYRVGRLNGESGYDTYETNTFKTPKRNMAL